MVRWSDPGDEAVDISESVRARVRFQGLPEGLGAAELEAYRGSVEVPCRPYYAYEEYLAVFGDAPGSGARS